MIRTMAIVATVFLLAQIHRSAGGIMALELGAVRAIGPSDIGLIIGIMPLTSALVQIPVGILLDRWGVRRTLSAMAVLASLGTIWLAVAEGVFSLTAARALIGAGFAAAMTSIYIVAIINVSPQRMALVAGTTIALAGSVGAALGTTPLVVAFQSLGWTTTFVLIGCLTLVAAFFVRNFVKDGPAGVETHETLTDSLRVLKDLLQHSELRRCFAMAFCFAGPFMTLGGLWVGPYLRDIYKMDDTTASAVILAMVLAYNIGALVYGSLDRLLGTRKWLVLGGAATTILTYGYFIFDLSPPLPIAIGLLVTGSLSGPYFIPLTAHCRGFVPTSRAGRTVTMMALVGITGIFFMQWVTGLVIDAFGGTVGENAHTGYILVFAIPVTLLVLCSLIYLPIRDVNAHHHVSPD
jgi:predicted MFS family arabinose efflux permease